MIGVMIMVIMKLVMIGMLMSDDDHELDSDDYYDDYDEDDDDEFDDDNWYDELDDDDDDGDDAGND